VAIAVNTSSHDCDTHECDCTTQGLAASSSIQTSKVLPHARAVISLLYRL